MRRAVTFLALFICWAPRATAQEAPVATERPRVIDGIVVRIEDDIITESDARELESFQQLVNGRARSRAEVIDELLDQWIVQTEAATARFPQPSAARVDAQFAQLEKQFSSPEAFRTRLSELGLTEKAVRRLLEKQFYLTRFLDYRFRPTAQVDQKRIEAYYHGEFASQLESQNQALPPLDSVQARIRELLTEHDINERSTQWLQETKAHLRIDIMPGGAGS